MKKICYVTTVSSTLNAFVKKFADYLNDTGEYEIYFICDPNEAFAESLPDYINYIPVPMKRGISLSAIKSIKQLRKIFKENSFDMVQYSTPNAACYASIAGYLSKIPVRLYCQWGMVYVGFSGLKRWIFKNIEKLICRLSTWIEPDSFGNLEFCRKEKLYSENKSSVVWNGSAAGVDMQKFDVSHKDEWRQEIREKYSISENAFVYIFIGRITRDKGINELLQASCEILAKHRDAYVMLVGLNEGQLVDKSLYEWSLAENRMIYTGFTTEVEKYIAASDAYVLPSYREGFGTSVIEAEAMGVPVIVTDIPGPTNAMVNELTGLIVKKADSEDLLRAMLLLKENSDTTLRMGEEAHTFVKEKFEQKELFRRILEDRINLLNKFTK